MTRYRAHGLSVEEPRRRRLRAWLRAGLASCLFLLAGAPRNGWAREPLLIKGGTLLDGTGRPGIRNVRILIEDGLIARVGKAGDFARPEGATVLRAGGLTILPGLIDAHVHVISSGVVGFSFRYPQPRGFPVFLRNLRAELMGGVTQVRDLNMPLHVAHRLSQAVRQDPTRGARLIYSGPLLAAPGGYLSPYSTPVKTAEEGREQVRDLVREGAGVIKVAVTRRDFQGDVLPSLSAEALQGIVEEAHSHGLPVAAHVAGATLADLRTAVDAGVDSLEHMPGVSGPLSMPDTFYTDPGLLADILGRGVTIVPTLSVEADDDFGPTLEGLWDDPSLVLRLDRGQRRTVALNVADFRRSPRRQATARAGRRRMQIFLKEVGDLHAAGVRLGVGTDAGNGLDFHGNLYTEIQYLHQAGLSPMDAIVAATRRNAEVLGIPDRAGTVEEGKRADLLLVRGNPLKDLGVLHHVEKVVIGGRVVDVRGLLKQALRRERRSKRKGESSP